MVYKDGFILLKFLIVILTVLLPMAGCSFLSDSLLINN